MRDSPAGCRRPLSRSLHGAAEQAFPRRVAEGEQTRAAQEHGDRLRNRSAAVIDLGAGIYIQEERVVGLTAQSADDATLEPGVTVIAIRAEANSLDKAVVRADPLDVD